MTTELAHKLQQRLATKSARNHTDRIITNNYGSGPEVESTDTITGYNEEYQSQLITQKTISNTHFQRKL